MLTFFGGILFYQNGDASAEVLMGVCTHTTLSGPYWLLTQSNIHLLRVSSVRGTKEKEASRITFNGPCITNNHATPTGRADSSLQTNTSDDTSGS